MRVGEVQPAGEVKVSPGDLFHNHVVYLKTFQFELQESVCVPPPACRAVRTGRTSAKGGKKRAIDAHIDRLCSQPISNSIRKKKPSLLRKD